MDRPMKERTNATVDVAFTVIPGADSSDETVLRQKLLAVNGIQEVDISKTQGRIFVSSNGVSQTAIQELITQSGYDVTSVSMEL